MNHPELETAVVEIEQSLPDTITAGEVAQWADVRDCLRAYAKRLTDAAGLLDGMCAETVPREKGAVVESEGRTFQRTGTASRKAWQTSELLRVVKDCRVFDPKTGELLNAEDLILKVWSLGAPRVTALRELEIDPDEFSETTWSNVGVKEVPA